MTNFTTRELNMMLDARDRQVFDLKNDILELKRRIDESIDFLIWLGLDERQIELYKGIFANTAYDEE